MKHIIAYAQVCALFISFMLVLLGNQSYGQWVQTNGIVGAGILSLGINDSNIFAGTNDNGVFRSTNAGTVNAIRFMFTSGNIASGVIKCYGLGG